MEDEWNINACSLQLIDWLSLEKAVTLKSKYSHSKCTKAMYRQWCTMKRRKKCGLTKTFRCPLCKQTTEYADHVLKFNNITIREARYRLIEEVNEKLKKKSTNPTLCRLIISTLQQLHNNFTIQELLGATKDEKNQKEKYKSR